MGTAILKIKLLPESPRTDLEKIKTSVKSILQQQGGDNFSFEEKPFAFGLKALFITFSLPEEKGTDFVEEKLSKIPEVSSISLEDYRRAFG